MLRIATAIRVVGVIVALLIACIVANWGSAGDATLWLVGGAIGAAVAAIAFGVAWIISGFAPDK